MIVIFIIVSISIFSLTILICGIWKTCEKRKSSNNVKRRSLKNKNRDIENKKAESYPLNACLKYPPSLKNNDGKCYVNSLVQALSSCSLMIQDFKDLYERFPCLELRYFNELMEALNSNRQAQECVYNFIHISKWKREGHQDAYELLCFFLNNLYNIIKKDMSQGYKEGQESKFRKDWMNTLLPFRCVLETEVLCKCNNLRPNYQMNFGLNLPLISARPMKLKNMIEKFFESSPIDQPCDVCGNVQSMKINLQKFPNTLCLQLQVNEWNEETQTLIKPHFTLDYPMNIFYKNECYKLVALIEHSGTTKIGHYVTYRLMNNSWYYVNDTISNRMGTEDLKRVCDSPYLLFYEKTISSYRNSSV